MKFETKLDEEQGGDETMVVMEHALDKSIDPGPSKSPFAPTANNSP